MHPRSRCSLLGVAALLYAHGIGAQPARAAQATRAAPLAGVSPAHCIATLERREAADPLRCPAALRNAIAEAQLTCRDAGGELEGAIDGNVWAIDVNGDRRSELAFELDDNVTCADAWSLFSCGSSDCPKTLYELRGGAWVAVGDIAATWPEQLRLGEARAADGHRSLEVCVDDGCVERRVYEWQGERYTLTRGDR